MAYKRDLNMVFEFYKFILPSGYGVSAPIFFTIVVLGFEHEQNEVKQSKTLCFSWFYSSEFVSNQRKECIFGIGAISPSSGSAL